jgi:hypothetical protein
MQFVKSRGRERESSSAAPVGTHCESPAAASRAGSSPDPTLHAELSLPEKRPEEAGETGTTGEGVLVRAGGSSDSRKL